MLCVTSPSSVRVMANKSANPIPCGPVWTPAQGDPYVYPTPGRVILPLKYQKINSVPLKLLVKRNFYQLTS